MRKTSIAIAFIAAVSLAPDTAFASHSHDGSPSVEGATRSAAAGPPSGAPCSVGEGVVACYVANGDVFWVKDKRADGYHVDAIWSPNGSDNNFCHDRHGADAGWTYCDGFADDIPENSEIVFRGGVFDRDHSPVGDGSWGAQLVVSTS